ncbi:site-specific integrase [Actinokineospora globicatena]|uniref:site-specific integrase n=1 Tax=Actinokineospora globicatena TaxID=103729 RepID=UPI0020A41055|nr:site-specific integrase [Actinokineospora globicatena]MCP2306101.1 Site-specific recombinase XerD [Actinokineospora globicatena]GLW80025.1 integrase [Actinokineospora globicatena]GLW86854.1 integrase [Actinokineospora globicatena]
MADRVNLPIGVKIRSNVEHRPDRASPFKARVRWTDPATKKRDSISESFATEDEATAWISAMDNAAARGLSPQQAVVSLSEYGDANMDLALRGLELKTRDPYMAGWRKRVVPTLGHIPVAMVTNGAADRAVMGWIADECSRSTVKNSLAVLVRVMEQAKRDGIVDRNPAQVRGWQQVYRQAEDELDDPRSLALPSWDALKRLADALVAKSTGKFDGWGDVIEFMGCTAARIGEASGCRVKDIDTTSWIWNVRRQTTPGPGGLADKGTKSKRARDVPIIVEIRDMIERRMAEVDRDPEARLFTGPRGGRITTAVLRDATHWDEVVTDLGYEHLRRHDLRHTGITWLADAGVPVHVLRVIAGHGSLTTTQRYIHPDKQSITDAGDLLSAHLHAPRTPQLRVV